MIETLEGTDRYLITRWTVEDADTFEALPGEFKETISEVHRDIGLGSIGTYGIDLDEEWIGKVEQASNLILLTRINDYGLGLSREASNVEEFTKADDLVAHVELPSFSTDVLIEEAPEAFEGRHGETIYAARYYPIGQALDQGREGACTGFSTQNFLNAAPLMSRGTNDDARRIYHRARQIDEWPGESYEGSSINAACRAAVEAGKIGEWGYLTSHESCIKWMSGDRGGIMYGMDWHEGMYVPNAEGYIRPTGRQTGGHAIFARGFNKWRDVRRLNSWGADWGYRGLCWMSRADEEYMWAKGKIDAICAVQIVR